MKDSILTSNSEINQKRTSEDFLKKNDEKLEIGTGNWFSDPIKNFSKISKNVYSYFYFLKITGITFLVWGLIVSPILFTNMFYQKENGSSHQPFQSSFIYRTSVLNKPNFTVIYQKN